MSPYMFYSCLIYVEMYTIHFLNISHGEKNWSTWPIDENIQNKDTKGDTHIKLQYY